MSGLSSNLFYQEVNGVPLVLPPKRLLNAEAQQHLPRHAGFSINQYGGHGFVGHVDDSSLFGKPGDPVHSVSPFALADNHVKDVGPDIVFERPKLLPAHPQEGLLANTIFFSEYFNVFQDGLKRNYNDPQAPPVEIQRAEMIKLFRNTVGQLAQQPPGSMSSQEAAAALGQVVDSISQHDPQLGMVVKSEADSIVEQFESTGQFITPVKSDSERARASLERTRRRSSEQEQARLRAETLQIEREIDEVNQNQRDATSTEESARLQLIKLQLERRFDETLTRLGDAEMRDSVFSASSSSRSSSGRSSRSSSGDSIVMPSLDEKVPDEHKYTLSDQIQELQGNERVELIVNDFHDIETAVHAVGPLHEEGSFQRGKQLLELRMLEDQFFQVVQAVTRMGAGTSSGAPSEIRVAMARAASALNPVMIEGGGAEVQDVQDSMEELMSRDFFTGSVTNDQARLNIVTAYFRAHPEVDRDLFGPALESISRNRATRSALKALDRFFGK